MRNLFSAPIYFYRILLLNRDTRPDKRPRIRARTGGGINRRAILLRTCLTHRQHIPLDRMWRGIARAERDRDNILRIANVFNESPARTLRNIFDIHLIRLVFQQRSDASPLQCNRVAGGVIGSAVRVKHLIRRVVWRRILRR